MADRAHQLILPALSQSLGQGEPLFQGIDLQALGYRVKERVTTEAAMHLVIGR